MGQIHGEMLFIQQHRPKNAENLFKEHGEVLETGPWFIGEREDSRKSSGGQGGQTMITDRADVFSDHRSFRANNIVLLPATEKLLNHSPYERQ